MGFRIGFAWLRPPFVSRLLPRTGSVLRFYALHFKPLVRPPILALDPLARQYGTAQVEWSMGDPDEALVILDRVVHP